MNFPPTLIRQTIVVGEGSAEVLLRFGGRLMGGFNFLDLKRFSRGCLINLSSLVHVLFTCAYLATNLSSCAWICKHGWNAY